MSEVSNAENIRAWLRTCPEIAAAKYFGADYIGENATEYSVMSVPSTLRYRENIIGKRVLRDQQEQNFVFAARVPYGRDVRQNLENLGFFQRVGDWIHAQNKAGNFPEWSDGIVTAVNVTNTGAPMQTGSDAAQYQFQIKVIYRIEERNE